MADTPSLRHKLRVALARGQCVGIAEMSTKSTNRLRFMAMPSLATEGVARERARTSGKVRIGKTHDWRRRVLFNLRQHGLFDAVIARLPKPRASVPLLAQSLLRPLLGIKGCAG